MGSGFAYSHTSYLNFKDAFSDRENWSLPADVYYELTPKVDLSVGYKYGNTDLEGRVDSADRVFEDYDYDTHFLTSVRVYATSQVVWLFQARLSLS